MSCRDIMIKSILEDDDFTVEKIKKEMEDLEIHLKQPKTKETIFGETLKNMSDENIVMLFQNLIMS